MQIIQQDRNTRSTTKQVKILTSISLKKLKRIVIAYPSGNTTAIVFDSLFKVDRKALNNVIMQSWKKSESGSFEIEQCCFITSAKSTQAIARVEMFGGEFCGNATRSAVWVLTQGRNQQGLIEVSGVTSPLEFSVEDGSVMVEMPLASKENLTEVVDEGILIRLGGITHLVVIDQNQTQTPRQLLKYLLTKNKYEITACPAFGLSFFNQSTNRSEFCVWVKEIDTIFDETACGSGTCAIGIAIAVKSNKSLQLGVIQPSGQTIYTRTELDLYKRVSKSFITGKVDVLYDGELSLEK